MFKKCLCVVFILFLSGCSSKFAYNNLDWLIYWYLDDYVELSDDQEAIFDEKLNTWLTWHRSEELVLYKQHLESIKQDIDQNNISRELIEQHLHEGRFHFERVRNEISPALAKMATELTDEQVDMFFEALEEDNAKEQKKIEKRQKDGREKAVERRVKEITKDLGKEIGRLSDEQKEIVGRYAPLFESTADDWLAYRRNIQSEARQLFDTRHTNDNFSQQLLDLMMNPDMFRSQTYLESREKNRQHFIDILMEIAPTLSDKQKRRMIREIDGIIDDLDDLMED